jgi:hypothetical protein
VLADDRWHILERFGGPAPRPLAEVDGVTTGAGGIGNADEFVLIRDGQIAERAAACRRLRRWRRRSVTSAVASARRHRRRAAGDGSAARTALCAIRRHGLDR